MTPEESHSSPGAHATPRLWRAHRHMAPCWTSWWPPTSRPTPSGAPLSSGRPTLASDVSCISHRNGAPGIVVSVPLLSRWIFSEAVSGIAIAGATNWHFYCCFLDKNFSASTCLGVYQHKPTCPTEVRTATFLRIEKCPAPEATPYDGVFSWLLQGKAFTPGQATYAPSGLTPTPPSSQFCWFVSAYWNMSL